ncbi:FAD-dependent oxidoreductase [Corynebacterium sp. H113]|uniref:FAD-dependent oxidoreductase n=1 Tax=Corynebacterium sp. H113 TaxID=3133419 RepID=UPI00309FCBB0
MTTTVIVGGVAGGMSTAARLRRRDENMDIIVYEASENVSFANCGLPYYVGGIIPERDSLLLQTPAALKARLNLDVFVSHRVTSIDRDAKTVTVKNLTTGEEKTQGYDFLVLSPGATPFMPPIPGIDRALTLRTVEDVDRIAEAVAKQSPQSAAIIGGGFIGLELAENLHHRGIKTTIVERAPQILAPLDEEMAGIVMKHLRDAGIEVILNADTKNITDSVMEVELLDRDNNKVGDATVDAELLVAAIGVRPESSLAKDAGLAVGERGGIKVDRQQRTSDPAVFALGDAAEKVDAISGEDTMVPLAQTANRHGRMVADIITGRDEEAQLTLGTAIVGVLGMAAGSVGWNERRARQAGKNVRCVHIHPGNHAGYYPGSETVHLKLVVDADTDAILGAQGVGGEGVDKRIDVIATAMRAGLKASDLQNLELAYAPQFGSAKDPINFLGFVNDNAVNGENLVQWHELEDFMADENNVVIDVSTAEEYAEHGIDGTILAPVDELREWIAAGNLEPLKGKNLLLICWSGVRSHVAATAFRPYGFQPSNLAGGIMTYEFGQYARA